MNADELSMIAGTILSLVFSYIPGLNQKFGELATEYKRLIMLILVVIVAGVVYGLACAGVAGDFGLSIVCDRAGLVGLARAIIYAAVANQATYGLTKR